jgi:hypothetical protein
MYGSRCRANVQTRKPRDQTHDCILGRYMASFGCGCVYELRNYRAMAR